MWKWVLGAGLAAAGIVTALGACEVSQISWSNHAYVVSAACASAPTMTPGAVTLHNGSGTIGVAKTVGGTSVTLEGVHAGDITGDGVQDAVVLLNCHDTIGGNHNGSELQVFTRNAKPIQRLVPPHKYSGGAFAPYFVYNQIRIVNGTLYTEVDSYLPGDAHASPSAHDTYRWDWNGYGFTPVDVTSTVTLGDATVTLPAGWVAEAAVPANPHSRLSAPTWCLMPHSRPTPASPDAAGCTIAFKAIPTSATLSPATPGGLVGNPVYCDPRQPQTVSLLASTNTSLGNRPAVHRLWLYSCLNGTRWPVEQYVTPSAPGYVLYSSQANNPLHAAITQIARTMQLPRAAR